MEQKEYFNEAEYQKNNAKVKKVGKILLILGACVFVLSIVLFVIGFLGFGSNIASGFDAVEKGNMAGVATRSFGSFGLLALGGFMSTAGLALLGAGGMTMLIAHRREITAYSGQQIAPLAKEGIEKATPVVSDSLSSLAEGITKGIKNGLKDDDKDNQ